MAGASGEKFTWRFTNTMASAKTQSWESENCSQLAASMDLNRGMVKPEGRVRLDYLRSPQGHAVFVSRSTRSLWLDKNVL